MTNTTCPAPEGGSSPARALRLIGASALASLILTACGGDENSPSPPMPPRAVTQVPASAAATDAALESFAFNLPKTDDTEPLTLDLVPMFPSSETEEPIATP